MEEALPDHDLHARLRERAWLDDELMAAIEATVAHEVDDAVAFAGSERGVP
jgi:TPP-dependent pyruvate/acetoin dehydrogenase alpha subunit